MRFLYSRWRRLHFLVRFIVIAHRKIFAIFCAVLWFCFRAFVVFFFICTSIVCVCVCFRIFRCVYRKNGARPMSTLLHRPCYPAHPSRSNQWPYIICSVLERAFERCIISQELNKCIEHYYWKSNVLEQLPWSSEVAKNEYIHLLYASLPRIITLHHIHPQTHTHKDTYARMIHASLANLVSTINHHNVLNATLCLFLNGHHQKPVGPLPLAARPGNL